ncbi:hypothetical protein [Methylobacterium sp. WL6]|uniref:hypothetical protein n=1 Tax=Methylobacterium sp. WL6 TaxID=2603901 RepID=UPI0011CAC13D|nr:hypothetical protein [Methylobacterium sp. WL6]TXN71729.1 hypothetical protein FV230_07350 [Methylobacterium sp. WL6]
MPTVRVLRPFANEHHDRIVNPGDMIVVDDERARALAENGLVERAVPVAVIVKPAPAPANKMAPASETMAPTAPGRRGPGRPPKAR